MIRYFMAMVAAACVAIPACCCFMGSHEMAASAMAADHSCCAGEESGAPGKAPASHEGSSKECPGCSSQMQAVADTVHGVSAPSFTGFVAYFEQPECMVFSVVRPLRPEVVLNGHDPGGPPVYLLLQSLRC